MRRTQQKLFRMAVIAMVAAVRAVAQEGQAPTRRIVISIHDCKLALIQSGRVVKIYDTAVGAPSTPTPSGTFTIINRIPYPTWYRPGKVVPPGKDNPLGTRWLGLSLKGFGIHGTNSPRSIGRAKSHGCVRMRNRDVEELFELVREGDVVEFHGRVSEELARIFGVSEPPAGQPAKAAESADGGA